MSNSIEVIRSSHNSTIKRMRSLGLRKHRETERAFVIEGRRIVEAALQSGSEVDVIVVADDADAELFDLAIESGAEWRIVDRAIFDGVMDTVTPQRIAAIVRMTDPMLDGQANPFVVILDAISDPGNVGTIIRTAAAGGASAVLIGAGSADPYGPKAVRASMGSVLQIPVFDPSKLPDERLAEICPRRWLADGDGEAIYSELIWDGGVALIVGSEARGASEWGAALATGRVSIPIEPDVESLNASIAAGVIIFEARRQRLG